MNDLELIEKRIAYVRLVVKMGENLLATLEELKRVEEGGEFCHATAVRLETQRVLLRQHMTAVRSA